MLCPDCGSKMHKCGGAMVKKGIEVQNYRCSNIKCGRQHLNKDEPYVRKRDRSK